MSATSVPINNPNGATEPVSGDADVQMEGSGTSTTIPSASSTPQTRDLRGKVAKALARGTKAALIKRGIEQANAIRGLQQEIVSDRETLQEFITQMEQMTRNMNGDGDAAGSAEVRAFQALREKQEAKAALKESQKQATEALQAKQKAEKELFQAKKAAEIAQKEVECHVIDKQQHERRVSELTQQLQEKEKPLQDEDEDMGDGITHANAPSTEALEEAKRREEELKTRMHEQENMLATLRRQLELQEKGKQKQKPDEPMEEGYRQQPLHDQPSVPKPIQTQRPKAGVGPSLAGTRRHREPPLPPNFSPQAWEDIVENTEFDEHASASAAPSLENLDAKVTMLINKVLPALQRGNNIPRPRTAGRDFKTPIRRVTNPDRNVKNAWVRAQMNELIGIKRDEDIKNIEELILPNSTLNLAMAAFEKDARIAAPPTFLPMRPNLNNING
ncbi:hypothetical protein BJ912DRAFT_1068744, partial [Pholiota molesta]